MNLANALNTYGFLWSPLSFAALIALAVALTWLAFMPSAPARTIGERLDDYLDRDDAIDAQEMRRPLVSRTLGPIIHRVLHALGQLAPPRNAAATQKLLLRAGEPGRLSVLDFYGLRVLCPLLLVIAYYLTLGRQAAFAIGLRNAIILGLLGFMLPQIWLRSQASRRQRQIMRYLPDTVDMLTIGVEAGLAFESALMRVSERRKNPLTRELRRVIAEMRVGTPRDVALQRMAERTGVADLNTFVAVLVQSGQLGVSVAEVLHTQAAEMRLKRRQRVEELGRQASVKLVFPLAFFILPALFIVAVGPAVPGIVKTLGNVSIGGPLP
jgi:tight adherence protein C